jgi:3-oxoacyl-[acyl-carrier-protein] synthase II
VAAGQAFADANCDWPAVDLSRVGSFFGAGMGGASSNDEGYQTLYGEGSDRIKPFTVLMGMRRLDSH